VVERTLAWLSKCGALLVGYDKHAVNYLGLLELACALLWYRRIHRLQTVSRFTPAPRTSIAMAGAIPRK
jgi:hypothetical protein